MQKNSGKKTRATRINSENFLFSRLFRGMLEKSKKQLDSLLSRDLAGYKGPGFL